MTYDQAKLSVLCCNQMNQDPGGQLTNQFYVDQLKNITNYCLAISTLATCCLFSPIATCYHFANNLYVN